MMTPVRAPAPAPMPAKKADAFHRERPRIFFAAARCERHDSNTQADAQPDQRALAHGNGPSQTVDLPNIRPGNLIETAAAHDHNLHWRRLAEPSIPGLAVLGGDPHVLANGELHKSPIQRRILAIAGPATERKAVRAAATRKDREVCISSPA